jgi:hypothetical protein
MTREERSKFIAAYSKVLTAAWADNGYMQRLQQDAGGALRQAGLEVPTGVSINVKSVSGGGTLEDQIRLYDEGLKAGKIDLYVPAQPSMKDGELSDAQLESIAGGGDCCCSCCPSCTST